MPEADTNPTTQEWTAEDRTAVVWLAALPAGGSAVLSLILFPTRSTLWPLAFFVTAVGAYATAFLGVLPILFALRKRGWTSPFHYAVAGFVGVLLPWFLVGLFTDHAGSGSAKLRAGELLLLAASIGAAMAGLFGWATLRLNRKSRART
jgi:hypothetical protein